MSCFINSHSSRKGQERGVYFDRFLDADKKPKGAKTALVIQDNLWPISIVCLEQLNENIVITTCFNILICLQLEVMLPLKCLIYIGPNLDQHSKQDPWNHQ